MSQKTEILSTNPSTDRAVKAAQHTRLGRIAGGAKAVSRFGLGAMAGLAVFSLMGFSKADPVDHDGEPLPQQKPPVNESTEEAVTVNDNMTFDEAFAAARSEVGPTGYFVWHGKVFNPIYNSEMNQLTKEEQKELYANTMQQWREDHHSQEQLISAIVIHDEAPEATTVDENMSFGDAFANARAEVGPGGVFEWHGNIYSTYTSEEWGRMTDENKDEFYASAGNIVIDAPQTSQQSVDIVAIDNFPDTDPDAVEGISQNNDSQGTMISEEYAPDGQGGTVHVALFEINGELVLKADTDGDGSFDTLMKADESGNLVVTNSEGESEVITLEELQSYQETIDSPEDSVEIPGNDDYMFATEFGDDFNPDASMDEWDTLG